MSCLRENILATLVTSGTFTHSYRYFFNEYPQFLRFFSLQTLWNLDYHSSKIRGLMKLSDETLKILPYFWTKNKKTRKQFLFLDFSFRETLNFNSASQTQTKIINPDLLKTKKYILKKSFWVFSKIPKIWQIFKRFPGSFH